MNPKQLANVLIKILGLSILVHALMSFASELMPMFQEINSHADFHQNYLWLFPLSAAVAAAIGVFLIVRSRAVAAYLFKDEEE